MGDSARSQPSQGLCLTWRQPASRLAIDTAMPRPEPSQQGPEQITCERENVTLATLLTERQGIRVQRDVCSRSFGVHVIDPNNSKAPSEKRSIRLCCAASGV